jgi:hypothetical protein
MMPRSRPRAWPASAARPASAASALRSGAVERPGAPWQARPAGAASARVRMRAAHAPCWCRTAPCARGCRGRLLAWSALWAGMCAARAVDCCARRVCVAERALLQGVSPQGERALAGASYVRFLSARCTANTRAARAGQSGCSCALLLRRSVGTQDAACAARAVTAEAPGSVSSAGAHCAQNSASAPVSPTTACAAVRARMTSSAAQSSSQARS